VRGRWRLRAMYSWSPRQARPPSFLITLAGPLRIDVEPLSPLRAVLDVNTQMEIAHGIEIEPRGWRRSRSASQIRRIVECFDAVGAALKRGEDAVARILRSHSASPTPPETRSSGLLEHLGRPHHPSTTVIRGGPHPKRALQRNLPSLHRGGHRAGDPQTDVCKRALRMLRHLLSIRKRYERHRRQLGSAS